MNSQNNKVGHNVHGCNGHHDHAAHADLNSEDGRRRVAIACLITAVFMCVEVLGGLISGSLALLADAAHMLTDSASLALAWVGYWLATKAPDEMRSYGFGRMRVIAAFANGMALLFLAAWIMIESLLRLYYPQPIMGEVMLWVAIVGLLVNLIAAYVLHGGDTNDINLSGALWHVLGDLLGSVAAIVAAIVLLATGWTPIDSLLSMLVALLVFTAGVRIVRRAGLILLQAAPVTAKPAVIRQAMLDNVEGIRQVEPLHVWQLTEDELVLTACIEIETNASSEQVRHSIRNFLQHQYQINRATIEVAK